MYFAYGTYNSVTSLTPCECKTLIRVTNIHQISSSFAPSKGGEHGSLCSGRHLAGHGTILAND
uniref:Uncharacterized protein n=1 Tax=Megaselia scalaris TaxID=36166 RepID=T1H322_MEGSC